MKKKLPLITTISMLLAISTFLFTGCSPKATVKKGEEQVGGTPEKRLITAITVEESDESAAVMINGNQPLTFTSVKQPLPPAVILYFPETVIEAVEKPLSPDAKLIRAIKSSQLDGDGQTSRVEIVLEKDLPYEVVREEAGLKLVFEAEVRSTGISESAVEEAKPAGWAQPGGAETGDMEPNTLQAVYAKKLEKGVEITVKADHPIENYKTFTIDEPARIVFDIFGLTSNYKREHLISVNSKWAKSVRHYGYPDRVRLVVDTDKAYLSDYDSETVERGLVVYVGGGAKAEAAEAGEKMTAAAESATKAWVNRLDFLSGDAGKSTVIVGTNVPVKYEIKKSSDRKLDLNLFNTNLPRYRQRPLITTRFESAVDHILPWSDARGNMTRISIELREAVPYFVEQTQDLLLVHFEASSISPRPLDAAELPAWKKAAIEPAVEEPAGIPVESVEPVAAALQEAPVRGEMTPTYTGEKIALDFYETDIKNVFRILREISGENFAIDKDVKGTVSLTFEKPVPWDQVLDLVLKMNQLGKVYEGNIIRVATMDTLKKEEVSRREKLEAKRKAGEEQKALEPLMTEYIPISYSNAKTEVMPHIEKILSKERGSISVDERTNQLIVTDIAEVIAQAKDIVRKIDRVTPQVIIEARIVEASTNFSREIGVEWGSALGVQSSDVYDVDGVTDEVADDIDSRVGTSSSSDIVDTNGSYGWNSAVNLPTATSAGVLGFNFIKVAGTPLLLNAKLMAMESQGEGKIISSPKIVTLDNKTAMIKQGLQYPYNKLDEEGNTTTEYLDITLALETTPHVTPDNRISMKVKITKTDIGSIINSQQSFTTKEATTELLVDDGDTIVIGGIIKSTVTDSESKIPWISEVPLLGWLFKSKAKSDNKEELLIFITPRIVQLEQRGLTS